MLTASTFYLSLWELKKILDGQEKGWYNLLRMKQKLSASHLGEVGFAGYETSFTI